MGTTMISATKTWITIAAFFLAAQTANSAPIYVSHSGDDTVGQKLAYNLRESIAKSAQHNLVYTKKDAAFSIVLITLKDNDAPATIYSAVLTIPQNGGEGLSYFINSIAGHCGSAKTPACADDIIAMFDQEITTIFNIVRQSQN